MQLFSKKKVEVTGGNAKKVAPQMAKDGTTATATVKVLGSGCAKCNKLEAAAKAALAELHMDTAIDHVTDFTEIATYGVMTTPALVIDDKVVSFGKVLQVQEIVGILKKARG